MVPRRSCISLSCSSVNIKAFYHENSLLSWRETFSGRLPWLLISSSGYDLAVAKAVSWDRAIFQIFTANHMGAAGRWWETPATTRTHIWHKASVTPFVMLNSWPKPLILVSQEDWSLHQRSTMTNGSAMKRQCRYTSGIINLPALLHRPSRCIIFFGVIRPRQIVFSASWQA